MSGDINEFDADPTGDGEDDPEFRREMFVLFRERGWQPADITDKKLAEEYDDWLK